MTVGVAELLGVCDGLAPRVIDAVEVTEADEVREIVEVDD